MKKKELILDFTSLLDVIMILLFIVISNMNQASLSVSEEANRELLEAQSQIEELSDERNDLLLQIQSTIDKEVSYADISFELEELKREYDNLYEDYEYLKITSNYDVDDMSVYESTLERITKVTFICNTEKNRETGNYEVKIDIYCDTDENDKQTFIDSIKIEHNLNLSKDERMRFNAEQVTELTRVLSQAFRNVDLKVIWFSIQYQYEDDNFSNLDLEIIKDSIGNLERSFSKSCYVDEIKLY